MAAKNEKTVSWFEVRTDKETDKREFVRIKPVKLMKITPHEVQVFAGNRKMAYPSNYDITRNILGENDGFMILSMVAYKRKSDPTKKLYPLPIENRGFNEGIAMDKFQPGTGKNVIEMILEDKEGANLVDQAKNLIGQLEAFLEHAKNFGNRQSEMINVMLGNKSPQAILDKSPAMQQATVGNAKNAGSAKRSQGEIEILKHDTIESEEKKTGVKNGLEDSSINLAAQRRKLPRAERKKTKKFNKWIK